MKIGYAHVSKQEQHEALQIDALKEAGCERWFVDKMTGSKAERKGLDEALAYLRPEGTFDVWKLDRAGRSITHLIELLKGLKERDIGFMSLTEQIDTTTLGGKLIFHLMGALAEFEREVVEVGGQESSRPLAKSRWLGRCLPIRVIPSRKFVRLLGSRVRHCTAPSKRLNHQNNYTDVTIRILGFTVRASLIQAMRIGKRLSP